MSMPDRELKELSSMQLASLAAKALRLLEARLSRGDVTVAPALSRARFAVSVDVLSLPLLQDSRRSRR